MKLQAKLYRAAVYAGAAFSVGVLVLIVGYILIKGVPHLSPELFAWEYNSTNVSMMPAIINTLLMTLLSLLVCVPLGIGAAIWLTEYAPRGSRLVKLVRMTAETLSGIPSIIYGLFGALFFVVAMKMGLSLLSGALTLSIMVLPREGRTYRIFASPVLREDKVRGVVLLALDISARYAAEASRREFTANVSHELKTPLTSISGYAEIIESGIAKTEDIPAFAGKIRAEAKRLVALVNDILELSQLDEKQGLGAKEHVALIPILNGLRESFAPIAAEKGVALSVEGSDAMVEGYPVLLRELFHNLIDNAIKYTPAGGSVTVRLSQQEGHIRCTVKDTGIGIPKEHQAHVFERFYRVDKSHSRQTGGTGLGLAIVKHAAEVHQAQVELVSGIHEGTTVSVTF